MASDPKYVRLSVHRSRTMLADVAGGTGWKISGLDVKSFPSNAREADFVRRNLRSGNLEPASRAEYEEVTEAAIEANSERDRRVAADERAQKVSEKRAKKDGVDEPEPAGQVAVDQIPPPESDETTDELTSEGGVQSSGEDDEEDLDNLTNEALRERLKAADLPTGGNKKELVERLRSAG